MTDDQLDLLALLTEAGSPASSESRLALAPRTCPPGLPPPAGRISVGLYQR